ncbi:Fructose-1,6-bisphosphatase 1 [Chionoecetes opilio]|uniref:Fructose-1,6-bisphosphatase 1 n=1 Tax=Chionoecetes opilio TaxID=41210 RepID=A0A8J5C7H3_CHIOP|nr:Fructose-1,6-bisphosphatase 1 [Chionoecetes opilio]
MGSSICGYGNLNFDDFEENPILQQAVAMATHGSPIDTNCMTLTRYLLWEQRKYPHATGELTTLVMGIQTAVKSISNAVRKAGIASLYLIHERLYLPNTVTLAYPSPCPPVCRPHLPGCHRAHHYTCQAATEHITVCYASRVALACFPGMIRMTPAAWLAAAGL